MSQTIPQMESTSCLLCLAIMLVSFRIPSPYIQARFGCNLQVQQLKGNSVLNCLIVQIPMIYFYLHLFLSPFEINCSSVHGMVFLFCTIVLVSVGSPCCFSRHVQRTGIMLINEMHNIFKFLTFFRAGP